MEILPLLDLGFSLFGLPGQICVLIDKLFNIFWVILQLITLVIHMLLLFLHILCT